MFDVAFDTEAEKEFLKLDKKIQALVANKIKELEKGNFANDKSALAP